MPPTLLSRREFLKLSGAALCGLAAPRMLAQATGFVGLGRVTTALIYLYEQPTFDSKRIGKLERDEILWLLEDVESIKKNAYNRRWYRLAGGYVHSSHVQRVKRVDNPISLGLPAVETIGEITYPYVQSYRFTRVDGWRPLYRLYYSSVHCITGIDEGPEGSAHYRITDHSLNVDYHVPARAVALIPLEGYAPLEGGAAPEDKKIHVSIQEQTLTAYEKDQAVFQTPVSTGLPSKDTQEGVLPTDTPLGSFRIRNKMPSRHMGNGLLTDEIGAAEYPGVPWTMFFHKDGYALHGAYWHDNFGIRMSHGCVNLPNEAAKWLFRWTTPSHNASSWYTMGEGTPVTIE